MRYHIGILGFTAALFLSTAPAALAQSASTTASTTTATPSGGIEEIIVTAEKRGENLQRVPITVTAISAADAKAAGVNAIVDLPTSVPGLVITPNVGNTTIFLRGVGTDQITGGTEASVATYVDGVYIASLPGALFSFNNIARVEVLKGPQGTLFGRNASGGVVNVVTMDPSFDSSVNGSVGYGNYNTITGQVYATGGLTDDVAADLALYYSKQEDGWGKNIFNGDDAYKNRSMSGRSKQLINLSANLTLTLAEDYSDIKGDTSAGREPIPGYFGVGGMGYLGKRYDVNYNYPSVDHFYGGGASAKLEYTMPFATLSDLVAYRFSQFDNLLDLDGTAEAFTNTHQHFWNNYLSNELQFQSLESSKVSWIGGLYYLNMNDKLNPLDITGLAEAKAGGEAITMGKQNTTSYAAYAQATFPIVSSLSGTLGVRYSHDGREMHGIQENALVGIIADVHQSKGWNSLNYRVALDYQINDDDMIYVSNSSGFKAGQFNLVNPTNPAVNPETLNATEVGLKSQWFDDRLRFDVAGFYYKYKNIQLTERVPSGVTLLLNAASGTVYGTDASIVAQPWDPLTLHVDFELLHARYDQFPSAPAYVPTPGICTPTPHSTGAPTGGNTLCTINASGNVMERAPDATLDIGADYRWNTGAGPLTLSGSYYYTSGSYFYPDNYVKQKGYGLFNGQLKLDRGDYSFSIWGKNLTKSKYYSYIYNSGGYFGTPGAPITYGVELGFAFE